MRSITLNAHSTAQELKDGIEKLTTYSVNVTRTDLEPGAGVNGNKEWLVTFLVDQGYPDQASSGVGYPDQGYPGQGYLLEYPFEKPHGFLSIGPLSVSSLSGTEAAVLVSEVQEGSFLGGSFILSYGGDVSLPVPYDVTAKDLRNIIILTFSDIQDVEVVYEEDLGAGVGAGVGGSMKRRFLITVLAPVGDLSLMTADGTALTGSNAAIRTYEVVSAYRHVCISKIVSNSTIRKYEMVSDTLLKDTI